ncbi:MAG: tRNA pseudouridine(55) synthase TruB [Moorellaceae bacterium]
MKPTGMTSHDVVQKMRRLLGLRRVGHGGTLDPAATGVLPLALGRATRLLEYVQTGTKAYRVEVIFGLRTATHDLAGEVLERHPVERLEEERLRAALPCFTGMQEQLPPMFSAVHYQGKRLYELARCGQEVPRQARKVFIYQLQLKKMWPYGPYPRALLDVVCSTGTYIRSLCHDLGNYLGCGAAVFFLLRKQSGPFSLEEAWTMEEVEAAIKEGREDFLLPLEAGVRHLPAVIVKSEAVNAVLRGAAIKAAFCRAVPEGLRPGEPVRLHEEGGRLLAIGSWIGDSGRESIKPHKVLA